jgi:hypothetical protein
VKKSRDLQLVETPSAVLVTGILSEEQANGDSQAVRAGDPVVVEDSEVEDSGGNIT